MSSFRTDVTRERPLAPAPLPVLAGVFLAVILLFIPASRIANDWGAVFGAVAVVALASILLDRSGRAEARRHGHPLWYDQRLPTERSAFKVLLTVAALGVIVVVAALTAQPQNTQRSGFGNPYPYFVTAAYLYLLIPQLVARRLRRRYDRAQPGAGDGTVSTPLGQ